MTQLTSILGVETLNWEANGFLLFVAKDCYYCTQNPDGNCENLNKLSTT
jgi:hypothetical protein